MVEPDTKTLEEMATRAKAVSKNAYCPYTRVRWGAVVLTDDGQMFEGCNVENASLGLTLCAERNAVSQMVARGCQRRITAVVTYSEVVPSDGICGACRQVIREFGPDPMILTVSPAGARRWDWEREPLGILWDGRHWKSALKSALAGVGDGESMSLIYADMNGLKQVNDTHGHDAGDSALKAYFSAVASAIEGIGHAFRLGGDEVLVVLPKLDAHAALHIVSLACTQLMASRPEPTDTDTLLSIAAGIIVASSPLEAPEKLRSAADAEQQRAKQRSRKSSPRPSVIAIGGAEDMLVIEHVAG